MRLRRRSRTPLPPDLQASREIADELRSLSRRLIGWTTTGTGAPAVDRMLYRGADEIERLIVAVQAAQPEHDDAPAIP